MIEWRVVLKRGPAAWILILTARPEAAPYMAQMRESGELKGRPCCSSFVPGIFADASLGVLAAKSGIGRLTKIVPHCSVAA